MIANCGHDERGKYTGGKAGDQSGTEWQIRTWYKYSGGWTCVLRHPDPAVRKEIAKLARASANNDLIGYDQNQRGTFWTHLKASGYDPAQITIACEADCSSGTSSIVKAVGYRLNIQKLKNVNAALTTSGIESAYKAAGFQVLKDNKYLTSDQYLLEGDIILKTGHHVCINVSNGSKVSASETADVKTKIEAAKYRDKSLSGTYIVNTQKDPLMLRSGAGSNKTIITKMPKGTKVQCYGYYNTDAGEKWLYIQYKDYTGYAYAGLLKKQ